MAGYHRYARDPRGPRQAWHGVERLNRGPAAKRGVPTGGAAAENLEWHGVGAVTLIDSNSDGRIADRLPFRDDAPTPAHKATCRSNRRTAAK